MQEILSAFLHGGKHSVNTTDEGDEDLGKKLAGQIEQLTGETPELLEEVDVEGDGGRIFSFKCTLALRH